MQVMSSAEEPPVGWIRFSWQCPWVWLMPALGAHLSHRNLAVCESNGECECFDRNMSRHTTSDLPWDSVPSALLQEFRLEKQPNPYRKSLSMSCVAPRRPVAWFPPRRLRFSGFLFRKPWEDGRISPEG